MTLAALLALAALSAPSPAIAGEGAEAVRAVAAAEMAAIPGGTYERLHGRSEATVGRFAIDRVPVTRGDYLDFVTRHAEWRRSAVKSRGYLADWSSDLDPGDVIELSAPVTSVSWYGAAAYCKSIGRRLPTVDEWEYVAAASETNRNAARDRSFINRLVALYASRSDAARKPVATALRNTYGVRGLHDRAWEWTTDFKPDPADHARHDHDAKGHKHTMSCASAAIGAADPSNYPAFMRSAIRAGLDRQSTMTTLGFRCAVTLS
jgi:sulfatase modifying factor 1